MGFGESGSHIIFFVASLILALAVVAVIGSSVFALAKNINENGKHLASEYRTDIAIINDPAAVSNYIYVKNIGRASLHQELTDVFIDGNFTESSSIAVEGGESIWQPGDVINITMSSLPSGTHRIRVVVENGVDDVIKYTK